MQIFYQPEIVNGVGHLDPEESKHCVRVLRKKPGDEISIVDGVGGFYTALIDDANPKKCDFTIKSVVQEEKRNYSIHIAIAPTKNVDRIEWFVEKAMELGIDKISFFIGDHSERDKINHERLVKKAVSAMKQSIKASMPEIIPLRSFSQLVNSERADQQFIAYVDKEIPQHLKDAASVGGDYLVLIGPEGDFSPREIRTALDLNFKPVSLGKSRLRTETAGIVACHTLTLIND